MSEHHSHTPDAPGSPFRLDALFARQATRTPDAVALIDDRGSVTFAKLAVATARMASALQAAGVEPGALVGVHLARSREYVGAVLGVLATGAAVVPLPPDYPEARVRELLAFVNPAAVVDADARPLVAMFKGPIVTATDAEVVPPMAPAPARPADPADPAFVLCSSGSTGRPKLIVRSHASFRHRLEWTWRTHPYAPDDACCQKSPMTTTHAVYELFEPLLRGRTVRILSDATVRSLESFWEVIHRERITRLLLVPSMLQASLDMPNFAAPAVRVLVLMGEYVSRQLATRIEPAFPAAAIHSIYGSTEASSALVCDLRATSPGKGDPPLGEPLAPEIRVHVLDAALHEVPHGTPGMLHLAGPMLFTGYLHDQALTAEVVVERDGERLYCTRDRVCRESDGTLRYLGRSDDVVKVRGFRVDLREVEDALCACTGINQGAIVAQSTGSDAVLAAYVSPQSADITGIRRALRARLPDYMVPTRLTALATLPRTAGGKIDRQRLRALAAAGSAPRAFDGSRTEQALARAWHAALGHADFERTSNFFAVGGSSLKTFAVIARLRTTLSLDRSRLPDDAVYRWPTFADLAEHLDAALAGSAPAAAPVPDPLVTLRAGRGTRAAPLFVIASAGGTVGVYAKLMHALRAEREVIGVRDPYLWGERDAAAGFANWISTYLGAIRRRQPRGPYDLMAYSSAGAFGYEIARRLRAAGEAVAHLILIDPLAMDKTSPWRFGYWALAARFMHPELARLTRIVGMARALIPRGATCGSRAPSRNDFRFTAEQLDGFEASARRDRSHVKQLSALMELDTGLPFALTDAELDEASPADCLDVLLAKARQLTPDVSTDTLARLAIQYPLQVKTQHHYRLRRLDAPVVLFEPEGPHCGMLATQLRPWAPRLDARRVPMSAPTARALELARCFPDALYPHYFCMRNDGFTQAVARQLDTLDAPDGSSAAFSSARSGPQGAA